MPTIYLVRHAHADWTSSDARPLSSHGRASALLLAERLGARRALVVPLGLTFEQAIAQAWAEPDVAMPASESTRIAQMRGLSALKAIMTDHR